MYIAYFLLVFFTLKICIYCISIWCYFFSLCVHHHTQSHYQILFFIKWKRNEINFLVFFSLFYLLRTYFDIFFFYIFFLSFFFSYIILYIYFLLAIAIFLFYFHSIFWIVDLSLLRGTPFFLYLEKKTNYNNRRFSFKSKFFFMLMASSLPR